jgi:hypothetical protein
MKEVALTSACSMRENADMQIQFLLKKTLEADDNLEDKGVCRRIISILDQKERELERTEWFHLAQNRIQLVALMNTVMKFLVPLRQTTSARSNDQLLEKVSAL